MRLYDLAAGFAALIERSENDEFAEISPEELDAALGTLEEKIENCAGYIKDQLAEQEKYKIESDRLSKRAASIASRVAFMKNYLQGCLELAKRPRVKVGTHKVRLQANGRPQITYTGDVSKLEKTFPNFIRVIPAVPESKALNSDAVIAAIKAKPDLELPAGLEVVRGQHIRIN